MKKMIVAFAAAAFLSLGLLAPAQAQQTISAVAVASCGTTSNNPVAGTAYPLTMNLNFQLCDTGSGGGGGGGGSNAAALGLGSTSPGYGSLTAYLNSGGAVAAVSPSAPLPVTLASAPLPTGAATSANQSTQITAEQTTATNSALQATAANQTTANTALTTIANNTGASAGGATTFFNGATGSGSALGASATFTGSSRDVGVAAGSTSRLSYFNAFFLADQPGTAYVDCSNDNTTFYPCASSPLTASTPLILTIPVMTRYHRARLINGSTAQTILYVNTSYTGG